MTRPAEILRRLAAIVLGTGVLATVILTGAGCGAGGNEPRTPAEMATAERELELIAAVKEAMVLSTQRAVARVGREDGYLEDQEVRVPMPDRVREVSPVLRQAGLGSLVDDLVVAMNRAAEKAAPEAEAILVEAARSMLVTGAPGLVAGGNDAMTTYFRQRTANPVESAYTPVIKKHLEAQPGYQRWVAEIPEARRQFPEFGSVDVDEVGYVTDAALDGLFAAIADEERAIRTRPEKRSTDLLQSVFGGR